MPSSVNKKPILLLGGTGKVSSRIAPLLSANGYPVILASRSGNAQSLPNCEGVVFDWLDYTTYLNPFTKCDDVSTIFMVGPPFLNLAPPSIAFIDLAISKGVQRIVLLSGSVVSVGDGPMMAAVSKHVISSGVEYAILKPTWFMENFSEGEHVDTIREQDCFFTSTGKGKVPFVSTGDIAAVALRALTDEVSHDAEHMILGSELFSYDDVARMMSESLGRKITHKPITEAEAASMMQSFGIPEDYARVLAELDTHVKEGKEEIMNDTVYEITGRSPRKLGDFVGECVRKQIWVKK